MHLFKALVMKDINKYYQGGLNYKTLPPPSKTFPIGNMRNTRSNQGDQR